MISNFSCNVVVVHVVKKIPVFTEHKFHQPFAGIHLESGESSLQVHKIFQIKFNVFNFRLLIRYRFLPMYFHRKVFNTFKRIPHVC